MKKHKGLTFWTSAIAPFILAAVALGISGLGPRATSTTRPQGKITKVRNKTRSFEVIQPNDISATSATDIDNHNPPGVKLSLRNGYDKNITALAMSINGLISVADFVYSEGEDQRGIAPQAVYTKIFSFAESGTPDIAARETLEIDVLAVVFDDKSSDGDPQSIAGILNIREGSKRQLSRLIQLLDNALKSAGVVDDSAFDRLKSQISSLSADSRFSSEKEDVLRWLNQSNGLNYNERIVRVKETCTGLFARL